MNTSLASRSLQFLRHHWRGLVLGSLVASGLLLASRYGQDLAAFLEWGNRIADQPLAVVVVIVWMAVLFTFALPGSLAFWLIAPFHPPLGSVAMLLAGSVAGAYGAYRLAQRMGPGHAPRGSGSLLDLLRQRGDVATQIALRVLPGFPHSVVNYAGGALHLPLPGFLLAAFLGLAVKWGVYASAVYGAVEAIESGDALDPRTLLPLFVLAGLLLLGALVRRRLESGRARHSDADPPAHR